MFVSSGVDVTSSSTRIGARAATMRSAAASPRSLSADGWIPCASSRSSLTAAASSVTAPSTAASGCDRAALRAAQPQQQRDQPLLRAVVEIPLDPPARVVGRGDDPRPRAPHLRLVALAVGDVGAGDQPHRAALDLRQRGARPGDVDLAAVALHPPALGLGGRAGADRREDAVAGLGPLAVGDVALPEEDAARLVRP